MDEVIRISLAGIICAVIVLILKQYKGEYASVIGVVFLVTVSLLVLSRLGYIIESVSNLAVGAGIEGGVISSMVRMLMVALVARIACSVCEDAGLSTVVTGIDIGSRILILAAAFPVFEAVIKSILELVS